MEFADFIEANDSFDWACRLPNNHAMKKQHPAIVAYQKLRKQEPNEAFLDFSLIQQMWLRVREIPERQPSDHAMVLLRVMAFTFLLSQGFSEHEVRDQLVETMEGFERGYAQFILPSDEPTKMRRTRWPGKVIPLFSGNNGGNRQ